MFDQVDEGFELFRLHALAHQLFQIREVFQGLEDGKLIPATEIRVVVRRHFKQLVEALEQTPLSDEGRDHIVDDAEVEMVAGDADARMADRRRRQASCPGFEADQ
ncbi:hypothetical protein D3C72_1934630 [compost metagenome]